jgi:pseudo-rSAM protein
MSHFWLIMEPYVYARVFDNRTLLYNPMSNVLFESKDAEIARVVRKLYSNKNSYSIKISSNEMRCKTIADFIDTLREGFMGDIIPLELSSAKPAILLPLELAERDTEFPYYSNIISLRIHLNSESKHEHSKFKNAFKQMFFPKYSGRYCEQHLSNLLVLFNDIKNSTLHSIHFTASSFASYSELEKLISFMKKWKNIEVYFYLAYTDDAINSLVKMTNLSDNLKIVVYLFFDHQTSNKEKLIHSIKKGKNFCDFHFIVSDEQEMSVAEELIYKFSLKDVKIFPYFTGTNLNFFKKYVYIDRESILDTGIDPIDIAIRKYMNSDAFGKLEIMSNGSVYANINDLHALGNLKSDSIKHIISKAMSPGSFWFSNRKRLTPCKTCTFQGLCPSIGNYEKVLGKNNLCHIYNGSRISKS